MILGMEIHLSSASVLGAAPSYAGEPHPIDIIRHDHACLGAELALLEAAENDNSVHLWKLLRAVCGRLSLALIEHIRREERLLVTYGRSVGAAAAESIIRPSVNHYNDYRYLQVISRHICVEARPFLLINGRYELLRDFLREFQRHMQEQERELFPIRFRR
jgi:hypothetical protein